MNEDAVAGEIGSFDAEGATAPETLRQKDRESDSDFWREAPSRCPPTG